MSRLAAPLSNQQIASYVRQAGFPEELVPRMVAIANAESSRIPNNRNFKGSDQSYGLFHFLSAKSHTKAVLLEQKFPR